MNVQTELRENRDEVSESESRQCVSAMASKTGSLGSHQTQRDDEKELDAGDAE